jgi:hypothetical protein
MRNSAALIAGVILAISLTLPSSALAANAPTPSFTRTPSPSPTLSSTPSPTLSPTSSPTPGTFLDISSFRGFVLLLVLIGIIVLVWFIPFTIDLIWSHRSQHAAVTGRQVSTLAQAPTPAGPTSFNRRHIVRALIAFTIVTIVGISLLLVLSGNTLDAVDLRKTLVAAVVAIVGTVVGFYFGGRTAEQAATAAAAQPTGAVTLTPATANFNNANRQNVFTLSNNSSSPVTLLSVAVTDGSAGFNVDTSGVPAGWWDGNTTIVAPSSQLSVGVTWTPPAGAGPFQSTLAIAHTGTGAPNAQLIGTKSL